MALITSAITYSSSSTWTVPLGCTEVVFECWGGGGSGAYTGGISGAGGGGGGGAYAKKTVYNPIWNKSYTLTVGLGGSNKGTGFSGDTSQVVLVGDLGTPIVKAMGGNGGGTSNAGLTGKPGSIGDVVYSGGTGGAGTGPSPPVTMGGGGGEGAGSSSNGNNGSGNTGGTGGSGGDGGQGYVSFPLSAAQPGLIPGGGGGGGDSTIVGKGGDGKIILTYKFNTNLVLNVINNFF